jgi:hypothetical protein
MTEKSKFFIIPLSLICEEKILAIMLTEQNLVWKNKIKTDPQVVISHIWAGK